MTVIISTTVVEAAQILRAKTQRNVLLNAAPTAMVNNVETTVVAVAVEAVDQTRSAMQTANVSLFVHLIVRIKHAVTMAVEEAAEAVLVKQHA